MYVVTIEILNKITINILFKDEKTQESILDLKY